VKLSANRRYGTTTEESTNRDLENVAFLRAIRPARVGGLEWYWSLWRPIPLTVTHMGLGAPSGAVQNAVPPR